MKSKLCLLFVVLCALSQFVFSAPARKIDFTVSGYTGSEELINFPIAVKLSTQIEGFAYNYFASDGSDIEFYDSLGQRLNYEIESWNPNGESLIWVRMPSLTNGTTFSLMYADNERVSKPEGFSEAVWSQYAAVWHMGSKHTDSTGHGFEVTRLGYTVNGDVGLAGECMMSPSSQGKYSVRLGDYMPYLTDPSKQTVSMWLYPTSTAINTQTARIFSNKQDAGKSGVELIHIGGVIYARGDSSDKTVETDKFVGRYLAVNNWTCLAAICDDVNATIYANGVLEKTGTINKVTSSYSRSLSVGNFGGGNETTQSYIGAIDEVRVFNGVASADWIKAEHDTLTSADFVTSSPVQILDDDYILIDDVSFTYENGGTISFNGNAICGKGNVKVVFNDTITNDVQTIDARQAPVSISHILTGLAADTTYSVKFVFISDDGTVGERLIDDTVHTGLLTISKEADAYEKDFVNGSFVITRKDTLHDLAVSITVQGNAQKDVDYVALSGRFVIPAGQSSVTVPVTPLFSPLTVDDVDVIVSIEEGSAFVDETMSSATVFIINNDTPAGFKTWIGIDSDGSKPSNWSGGVLPVATDKIFISGEHSQCDLVWDAKTDGLPSEVASWTQSADYNKVVTIATTYPEYANSTFKTFTVNGDMEVLGGSIVQKSHGTKVYLLNSNDNRLYILKLHVTGNMTIGENAKISASEKGYYTNFDGYRAYAAHGGESNGNLGNQSYAGFKPYGDIFEPIENATGVCAGTASWRVSNGGGAVHITVGGTLINNGSIEAVGQTVSESAGLGGSVYVNAQNVVGMGLYNANAGKTTKSDGAGISASGGRVAIISASETTVPISQVSADGFKKGGAFGSPGTIYLKSGTERKVIVKNISTYSNTMVTQIPAMTDDVNNWKAQSDLDIIAGGYSHIRFTRDIVAKSISVNVAGANKSDIDLAGNTIIVSDVFVDGVPIVKGTYTLADAQANGYEWLLDSSEGAVGRLIIGNSATVIVIK